VLEVVTRDAVELERLTARLAPDLGERLTAEAREVAPAIFEQLAPLPPATGVIALAERRPGDPAAVLAERRAAPVILLEDPRDLGNMGACVRVAAAADAAGVLTTGGHDPWHPDALRGAAGLHYAVPVCRLEQPRDLDALDRPLLAVDPEGEPLEPAALDPRALLAFGSERQGLSQELTARAEARLSIPMRAGVSSLNLATAVAAVLFAWRLSARAVSPLA
jgi:RNA methyltransferase, TrmH family